MREILPFVEKQCASVTNLSAGAVDQDDDYPDIAYAVASRIGAGAADKGILICGSGVGVCVVANKVKGVRAAICHDTYSASQGVRHDDMNLLCLGGEIVGVELVKELIKAFLSSEFEPSERFGRRLQKVRKIEDEICSND